MTTYLIPYPPATGNRTTRRGRGHFYTLDAIKDYRAVVLASCLLVKRDHEFAGQLRVVMIACPPDARPRDHDNAEKVILDALVKASVLKDDSNKVCKSHAWEWRDQSTELVPRGYVRVYVSNAGRSE